MEKGLAKFFEDYLEKRPIFKDKHPLQPNYMPDQILYREDQVKIIAQILAPVLRSEKCSNVFIYGKTGTGKTLVAKYVAKQLSLVAEQRNIALKIIYINCKLKRVADTEYRLIAQLSREFNKSIPPTGLPTDEVYSIFFASVDGVKQNVVLVLDEIDQLIGKVGSDILYNLTRMNAELKNSQVSIIGISNDLMFTEHLDPRVKSSLSEEEITFPPYNAEHIQSILDNRAKLAFNEGVFEEGVLEKCAAFAAREHGDARRALELLRIAGEIAERAYSTKITFNHLDEAEEKIERDRFIEIVKSHPKQHQLVLYVILSKTHLSEGLYTGEIYESYQHECAQVGLRPLTQRRVGDIIAEFDMLGLVNAKVVSKGRYGRMREVYVGLPNELALSLKNLLVKELNYE